MTALQNNSTDLNPNKLEMTRVARYERLIQAPLVRVWENVLDWEHLPHLHATSFDFVELDSAGDWGWRTWSDAAHNGYVELCVANDSRYVARSYQGTQQVSEIWTTLQEKDSETAVTVEFYIPGIEESAVEAVGDMMVSLYTKLWDEDESMMRQRHHRLLEKREESVSIKLGERDTLIEKLLAGERILFQLKKREFQLRYHDEELLTHPTMCPHLLGPLTDSDLSQGLLTCPWHRYQFDLASGACVRPPHATCSLPPNAVLSEDDGHVIASTAH